MIALLDRCTPSPAQSVGKKIKYPLSQMVSDPFTVENVIGNIDQRDISRNIEINVIFPLFSRRIVHIFYEIFAHAVDTIRYYS